MITLKNVSLAFPNYYQKHFSLFRYVHEKFNNASKIKPHDPYMVLDNVSLQIAPGEAVGIIGRNGSGKTTLLRIMAKIYEPDCGDVTVIGKLTPLLGIGIGFDSMLSGLENIYLNGLLIGLNKKTIESKIEQIVAFSELQEHINKPLKYYSSGMVARLGFSISLATNAEIMLIDEIFSVGDIAFNKKSGMAVLEKLKETTTKVIVSHSLSLISELCTRVIVLENKKIAYDGEVKEGIKFYEKIAST